jgi:AAA domain
MVSGFQLRSLRIIGRTKAPAEILFHPGFNVISGASNTGKSYILQCINFMLGGSKSPKKIDESVGYETCLLEIEDHEGTIHQLERSLSGNAFIHRLLMNDAVTLEETLSEKHDPNDQKTVSGLLLGLSAAWNLKIRMSQAGRTRPLSFRDLARLTLVDEMRIISDASPVLSGQYSKAPEEVSLFKLILTGVDDSSVIATESRKENKAKRVAQLELLDRMIPQLEKEIADLDKEPASIAERRKKIDETVTQHSEVLTTSQKEIAEHEQKRREAWEKTQTIERQQANTVELRRRFKFLEEHYNNDLARLLAIIEVDSFLGQLQQVRCPLCGSSSDQHDPSVHDGQPPDVLQNIQQACHAEIAKIRILLRDLVGTTTQLDAELSTLQAAHSEQTSLFQSATQEIRERLNPAAKQYELQLGEAMQIRDRLAHAAVLQERLQDLTAERSRVAGAVWKKEPKTENSDILLPQAIESFTLKVQGLLEAWKYPGLTRVTFSDEKLDLIISGKERASEGKGFRAIAYAAFMIGLLDYCVDSKTALPHPGLVVLDSPLVTYKRRDTEPGEELPEDVAAAFYKELASLSSDRQVIVLENNDPQELHSGMSYTHFSRAQTGRYGFFPKD